MNPAQIGNYRVVGRIGQGAMGVVYKAHDDALGRFVAIKTISANLLSDEQYRKRFQREARSAAQLNHPNIVTVFEFAETGGQTYLVMELLLGTDLRDLIARRALRGLDRRLAIVEQILDGLAFAHAKGVVHRDLKPANIQVLPDGTAKLLDFGLARLGVSEMTRTGTVMGTPNYMSPEQIRAEPLDGRSDLFSVGAILYELLASCKAFDAENMHATLFEVLEREPVPLARAVPGLPSELVALVEKALAKAPEQRYASAGEMGESVRRVRQSLAAAPVVPLSFAPNPPGDASPEAVAPGTDEDGFRAWSSTSTTIPTATFTPTVHRAAIGAHAPVLGSAAPSLEPATRGSASEKTARVEPTATEMKAVSPSATTRTRLSLRMLVGASLIALLGVLWILVRPAGPGAPVDRTPERQAALRAAVVASRVELARVELQNKDYAEAARQAEGALALEPNSSEARTIVNSVRETMASLDAAAREARASFERGDVRAASQALSRVLDIDSHHPVAGELSAQLNQYFKVQAEQARRVAASARAEAEHATADDTEPFRVATRLVKEAEALIGRGAYAEATQKLVEAADSFGRARRSAETRAAEAAAARAAARVSALPSLPPFERTLASPPPAATGSGAGSMSPNPAPHVPPSAPDAGSTSDVPSLPPPVTPGASPSSNVPPGSLRVTAKPWAEVSIDEIKRGRTPLNPVVLAAGPHAVVLVHPDYQPLRRVITIKSGELSTLSIDMRDEALRKR